MQDGGPPIAFSSLVDHRQAFISADVQFLAQIYMLAFNEDKNEDKRNGRKSASMWEVSRLVNELSEVKKIRNGMKFI